ncbi:cystatin-like [Stegostoma tigrinum]|uniref:cystatin-like n=1 Tax=Stegostoma tigrinum TaxID=3053191 RepID=UPI00202B8151|nr:cystatin-like [Stegostoma tigrinum]
MVAGMKWTVAVLVLGLLLWAGLASAIPGGLEPADVNSEEVQEAARFALGVYNRGTNDIYLSKIVEVLSAESQLVQGMLYHVRMALRRTNCRKAAGQNVDLESCSFQEDQRNGATVVCTFEVWDQPWISQKEVRASRCVL